MTRLELEQAMNILLQGQDWPKVIDERERLNQLIRGVTGDELTLLSIVAFLNVTQVADIECAMLGGYTHDPNYVPPQKGDE